MLTKKDSKNGIFPKLITPITSPSVEVSVYPPETTLVVNPICFYCKETDNINALKSLLSNFLNDIVSDKKERFICHNCINKSLDIVKDIDYGENNELIKDGLLEYVKSSFNSNVWFENYKQLISKEIEKKNIIIKQSKIFLEEKINFINFFQEKMRKLEEEIKERTEDLSSEKKQVETLNQRILLLKSNLNASLIKLENSYSKIRTLNEEIEKGFIMNQGELVSKLYDEINFLKCSLFEIILDDMKKRKTGFKMIDNSELESSEIKRVKRWFEKLDSLSRTIDEYNRKLSIEDSFSLVSSRGGISPLFPFDDLELSLRSFENI